jgi:8-oxo-dGTP diphosphatase
MPCRIRIASAIINSPDGRTLLVRKRGAPSFMQAGGKIENGETPLEALRRELWEELNLMLAQQDVEFVGRFEAPAANEPRHIVVAEIFKLALQNTHVQPGAEISEIMWVDPKSPPAIALAPLTKVHILPIA